MPISATKTRIVLTIDKELLAWVDAQADKENRDRTNYINTLVKREKERQAKNA